MENKDLKNEETLKKIEKGLDLTFKKLVKSKRQTGGIFVFCENGVIKKVRAEDMKEKG